MNNNPLVQYFRRPAVYLKLPSGGKIYSSDVINLPETGELPIYPMTAIDEITIKTPDALFNGAAIVDLIKSCVPSIIDPWEIKAIDLDAILLAIRTASNGGEMETITICPACKEETKYGINLMALMSTLKVGNYDRELVLGDIAIKFKSLTYKEINEAGILNFEIQKKLNMLESIEDNDARNDATKTAIREVTETTMSILSKTIEYIRTPNTVVDQPDYICEFVKNCDRNTYETIKKNNMELKVQSEIQPLNIKCANCNHEYTQPFTMNLSDFFV